LDNLAMFSADILSTDGTKLSSVTHIIYGSKCLSTFMTPSFSNFSNVL